MATWNKSGHPCQKKPWTTIVLKRGGRTSFFENKVMNQDEAYIWLETPSWAKCWDSNGRCTLMSESNWKKHSCTLRMSFMFMSRQKP